MIAKKLVATGEARSVFFVKISNLDSHRDSTAGCKANMMGMKYQYDFLITINHSDAKWLTPKMLSDPKNYSNTKLYLLT